MILLSQHFIDLLDKPKLTKFSPRVGRRKCFLCHAPVEDVAVAIIGVEDRCKVPKGTGKTGGWGSFAWEEGSPRALSCSAEEGSGQCLPFKHFRGEAVGAQLLPSCPPHCTLVEASKETPRRLRGGREGVSC